MDLRILFVRKSLVIIVIVSYEGYKPKIIFSIVLCSLHRSHKTSWGVLLLFLFCGRGLCKIDFILFVSVI